MHKAAEFYLKGVVHEHVCRASLTLVWDKKHKQFARVFMPRNLLEALWLQFEHSAFGKNTKSLKCAGCGESFEPGRTNQDYCGEDCRKKTNRRRRKQAKEMQADGRSIEEIAQELGVEPKMVQGWFPKKKEKRDGKKAKRTR